MIRKEYKLVFNNIQFEEFLQFVNPYINQMYPSRHIFSSYYDTESFQLYTNSVNVETEKFKIRLRRYDNKNEIFLERKITLKDKYKTSIKYKENTFPDSFFYNGINYMRKVDINYNRDYFKLYDARVTVDSDIKYTHPFYKNSFSENLKIVEFKLLEHKKPILPFIPFQTSKFSKYENAIKKIYNLN